MKDIIFEGAMTVDKASAVRDELLGALRQGEPVRVSCAGVHDADMSFFLVLLAAQESFSREGLEITFAPGLAEGLAPLARAMGFHRLTTNKAGGAVEAPGQNATATGGA